MSLTAYKTVFVKPDAQSRLIDIDRTNALCIIFNPIDQTNSTSTLSEVRFLFKVSGSTSIKYTLALHSTLDTNNFPTALTQSTLISSADAYATRNELPTSDSAQTWLSFTLNATLTKTTTYALVLMSDLLEGGSANSNGVYYSELPYEYADTLVGTGVLNESAWYSLNSNGANVTPNIFMYGDEINETNGLDLGTTKTSGAEAARGYGVYFTLVNTGDSEEINVRAISTQASSPVGQDIETFAAPSQWMRFSAENNFLPRTSDEFKTSMVSAQTRANIKAGGTVLYLQQNRIYPYPKPFIKVDLSHDHIDFNTTIKGITDLTDSVIDETNEIVYIKSDDAQIKTGQNSVYNFQTYQLINTNNFTDKNGQILPTKSQSTIVGKNIRPNEDYSISCGFPIKTHDRTDKVIIKSSRLYPEYPNINSAAETENSTLSRTLNKPATFSRYHQLAYFKSGSYSAVTDFDQSKYFPLNTYTLTRITDSYSQVKTGELTMKRLFLLGIDDQSALFDDNLSNTITANENQIPLLVCNNNLTPTSSVGNAMDVLGFSLYRGRASEVQANKLATETYDTDNFILSGLMDPTSATGALNRERGLLLVQHFTQRFCGVEYVPVYLISNISSDGVYAYGMVVSVATVNRSSNSSLNGIVPSEPCYVYLYKPTIKGEIADYAPDDVVSGTSTDKKIYLCVDPFANTYLDSTYAGDTAAAATSKLITIDSISETDYKVTFGINDTCIPDTVVDVPESPVVTKAYPMYVTYNNPTAVPAAQTHTYGIGGNADAYTNDNIVLFFDTQSSCINAPSDKTFYNEHNLAQLKNFIDVAAASDSDPKFYIRTTNLLSDTVSFKSATDIKSDLDTLWAKIKDGTQVAAGNNYKDFVEGFVSDWESFTSTFTPKDAQGAYAALIYFFGANNDSSEYGLNIGMRHGSDGNNVASDLYTNKILIVPFSIYPSSNTGVETGTIGTYTFFDQLCENNLVIQTVVDLGDHTTGAYKTDYDAIGVSVDYVVKGYYVCNGMTNIEDVMKAEYFAMEKLYENNSDYIPYIKDYTIMTPFFKNGEMEPDFNRNETDGDSTHTYFTGTSQLYDTSAGLVEYKTIEQDFTTSKLTNSGTLAYEVLGEPNYLWGANSTEFSVYDKYDPPVNPTYVNKDDNFTDTTNVINSVSIFNFYSSDVDNPRIQDQRSLIINLQDLYDTNYGYGYGYGYDPSGGSVERYGYGYEYLFGNSNFFDVFGEIEPLDEFNRITFAYKITKPLLSPSSANANIKLYIETSDTEHFWRESNSTTVVFDGVLNGNDPTTIVPTTFTDNILKISGYELADGFCYFSVDLKYAIGSSVGKYLRIYAEKPTGSIVQDLRLSKLRLFYVDERTTQVPSIFGTCEATESAITATGTTFYNNNEYFVVDFGKEKQIRHISFTIEYLGTSLGIGADDILTISYKNFNRDFSDSEKVIRKIGLKNAIPSNSSTLDIKMPCNFFGRLLVFNKGGYGKFKIKYLTIGMASIYPVYDVDTPSLFAEQYECSYYDENLLYSPENRVAKLKQSSNSAVAIRLGDSDVSTNQISFNCDLSGMQEGASTATLRLSYSTVSPYDISSTTTGWTKIKDFIPVQYERLPVFRLDNNSIAEDNTVISIKTDTLTLNRFSGNGLADWIIKPDTRDDIIFSILESWADSGKGYIRINADMGQLNLKNGMYFIIEKPTVVSFPTLSATALQISVVYMSSSENDEIKINSLKAYNSIITTDVYGQPESVAPTASLEWNLEISSN
jgi:hypothetical protein